MKKSKAPLWCAALPILLACGSDAPQSDSDAWSRSSPAELPSVTVDLQGVAGFEYGMRVSEVERIVGVSFFETTDGRRDECDFASLDVGADTLAVMVVEDRVVRVDVRRRGIRTAAGVQVGDSEEQVKALYPSVEVSPHKYTDGHYLTVHRDSIVGLVFETDGATVLEYRAGAFPEVGWVEGCS